MDRNIGLWLSFPWKGFSERTKDLFLATVITLIGIIGSYLILGGSIRESVGFDSASESAQSSNIFGSEQSVQSPLQRESLSAEVFQVQGSFRPNESLSFYYISFDSDHKYLIDFGNGIRQRLIQPRIHMKYAYPGIYLVQLYEMTEGKWVLISSQNINIKSHTQASLLFL
jgi:hypothetical protein